MKNPHNHRDTHPCAAELTRMMLIQKPPIQGVP
jgi:hypothetical protein